MDEYEFNQYGYNEMSGFYGVPQQITDEIYKFNVAVTTSIDAQTIQQHEDAVSAITVRHEDAVETRRTITTVFGNLIGMLRKLFGKDDGEGNEGEYYSMMKSESDQTQQLLCAQTAMQKSESDETQGLMSANTAMQKAESDETQNLMSAHTSQTVQRLQEIKNALTAHTNTMGNKMDTQAGKLDNIKNAIDSNTTQVVAGQRDIKNAVTENTAVLNDIESDTDAIKSDTASIKTSSEGTKSNTDTIKATTGKISGDTNEIKNTTSNWFSQWRQRNN